MRSFFIVVFWFPFFANTQKLVMLDRNFQHPVSIVDSISMEEAAKGAVAVYAKDISPLVVSIQGLIKYVADGKTDKEEVFDLNAGHSKYVVKVEKTGGTNHYNIVLNTDTGNFKTAFALVSHQSNKRAVQRLTMFIDYLRNNISILPDLEIL